ncbi:YbhB/YbcL family Raf kinase inhibitor-like protein [Nocardia alba]|uniref:PBP family phospholipid-binding protein n=1 Tax=Nocardia alba TaxID=225051 RepID=A0A4R1G1V3_9NOCA|nr:YbhB/YbcL family Raf kinase inhibitor-like protein [Nocardia alba]TCJ97681.1 PBP family phospholipid-binding protein [Nocardia alba]
MSYHPYALAFPAVEFDLRSDDFDNGGPLPTACYNTDAGANQSPSLIWSGLPDGTRSLVITAFDADAPIPGGLWHWVVKDVPAVTGTIKRDAGADGGTGLPAGAVTLVNDLGQAAYSGVQPPPGTGTHRLFVCATALSVDRLEVPEGASLAMLNILMIPHTVGRAVIVGTSDAPA